MEETKRISIATKMLVVAICVVFSALCVVGLTGCSSPSPTDVTQQFLDGIKNNDTSAIEESYAGNVDEVFSTFEQEATSEEDETTAAVRDVYENNLIPKMREFDYEISNEQIDGDTATVDVTVTTYAVGDALKSFASDYLTQAFSLALSNPSEDEMNKLGVSILTSKIDEMEKTYTETATVQLSKDDNNAWKVDSLGEDDEFTDVILGGAITASKSLNSFATDAS